MRSMHSWRLLRPFLSIFKQMKHIFLVGSLRRLKRASVCLIPRQDRTQRSGETRVHLAKEILNTNVIRNVGASVPGQRLSCVGRLFGSGAMVTGAYYTSVSTKSGRRWSKKGKLPKGMLFVHDNGPAHKTFITVQKLSSIKFQVVAEQFCVWKKNNRFSEQGNGNNFTMHLKSAVWCCHFL